MVRQMEQRDKSLVCQKCRQPFIFSVAEQEYFAAKKLQNEPKRCSNCRIVRRLESEGKDLSSCTEVKCEICEAFTVVPFKLTGNKPVYCAPCMHRQKEQSKAEEALPPTNEDL